MSKSLGFWLARIGPSRIGPSQRVWLMPVVSTVLRCLFYLFTPKPRFPCSPEPYATSSLLTIFYIYPRTPTKLYIENSLLVYHNLISLVTELFL